MLSLVARKDIHINIIYVCKGSAFMNIKRKKGQKAAPKRPKKHVFSIFFENKYHKHLTSLALCYTFANVIRNNTKTIN